MQIESTIRYNFIQFYNSVTIINKIKEGRGKEGKKEGRKEGREGGRKGGRKEGRKIEGRKENGRKEGE